jgi:hypothetical protein
MRPARNRKFRKAFTMIEGAIAAGIVGMAVASLMTACGACTQATGGGSKISKATFLAQEVREWTLKLPFSDPDPEDAGGLPGPDMYDSQGCPDDLDDLMGVTYDPPRGGHGGPLQDMPGWSQTIQLTWVNPVSLATVHPGGSDAAQVEVSISFEGRQVFTTGWLVIRR